MNRGSPEMDSPREADCGDLGVPSRSQIGEGLCRRCCSGTYQRTNTRGLRGWHVRKEWQQKTGTARGWPRRSRTAEASHISRSAMKLGCAREWGGWGRLSDDGRDSKPDRSEGPWGRWVIPPRGGAVHRVNRSDFGRINAEARRAKTNRMSVSVCREQA